MFLFFPDDWVVCVPILGVCTCGCCCPNCSLDKGRVCQTMLWAALQNEFILMQIGSRIFLGWLLYSHCRISRCFLAEQDLFLRLMCILPTNILHLFFKNACDIATSSQIEERRRHFIIYCRHIINCNFYRFKAPARYFVEVTLHTTYIYAAIMS